MPRDIACPICKATVAREAPTYPFCSERCRLIDLGNWLDGRYGIPSEESDGEKGPGSGGRSSDP